MAYNPYVAGSKGNTVEIPSDFPTSIIDDYYRAVVASRQRDLPPWYEGMGYGALQYANNYLDSWTKEDLNNRNLDAVLEREKAKYQAQKAQDLTYYQQQKAYDDQLALEKQRRQGEAVAALDPYLNPPAPEDRNPYQGKPIDLPVRPEMGEFVDTPGEPGGGFQTQNNTRNEPVATPGGIEPRTAPPVAKKADLADALAQLARVNPLYAGVYADMMGTTGRANMLDPDSQAARRALEYQRTQAGNLAGVRAGDIQSTQPSRILANEGRASRNFNDAARLWSVAQTNELKLLILQQFMNGEFGDPNSPEAQQFLAAAGLRPSYTPQQQGQGQAQGKIDAYQEAGLPVPGTQPRMQQGHGPRLSANDQMKFDQIKAEVRKQMPTASDETVMELTTRKYLEWKQSQRGPGTAGILDAIKNQEKNNVAPKKNPLIK